MTDDLLRRAPDSTDLEHALMELDFAELRLACRENGSATSWRGEPDMGDHWSHWGSRKWEARIRALRATIAGLEADRTAA